MGEHHPKCREFTEDHVSWSTQFCLPGAIYNVQSDVIELFILYCTVLVRLTCSGAHNISLTSMHLCSCPVLHKFVCWTWRNRSQSPSVVSSSTKVFRMYSV